MKLSFAVLAAMSFAVAAPAFAADAAPAKPVKEKKICRLDSQTGSIVDRRICHTKAEWESIDAANASTTESTLTQSRQAAAVNK